MCTSESEFEKKNTILYRLFLFIIQKYTYTYQLQQKIKYFKILPMTEFFTSLEEELNKYVNQIHKEITSINNSSDGKKPSIWPLQ